MSATNRTGLLSGHKQPQPHQYHHLSGIAEEDGGESNATTGAAAAGEGGGPYYQQDHDGNDSCRGSMIFGDEEEGNRVYDCWGIGYTYKKSCRRMSRYCRRMYRRTRRFFLEQRHFFCGGPLLQEEDDEYNDDDDDDMDCSLRSSSGFGRTSSFRDYQSVHSFRNMHRSTTISVDFLKKRDRRPLHLAWTFFLIYVVSV